MSNCYVMLTGIAEKEQKEQRRVKGSKYSKFNLEEGRGIIFLML